GVSVVDALWRAVPVRKPVLHGRAGAHPENCPRHARALRPHHRARRRSAADVGLQRDRPAAGRAVDRADRPRRSRPRQKLRRPHRDRYGYHALASGGIGWGLPASVGVSLANPERPVVCYSGDGSSMYSIQSLWTAANHKLPLTFVIVNNGGYRIIKQRLLAFH